MRKLKLDLNNLVVDSFATAEGRVLGHDSTAQTDCGVCDGGGSGQNYCPSVIGSCPYTCADGWTCKNSAFPCQSQNACHTDAVTCNSAGWGPGCVWVPPPTYGDTCGSCPTCAYC